MAIAPIQTQILQGFTQLKDSDSKSIKGIVVGLEGNQVVVEVMGQRLTMSAETFQKFQLGQMLSFSMVELPDGKMGLKLNVAPGNMQPQAQGTNSSISNQVPESGDAYEGILKTQLSTYGIQVNDANMSLVKAQRGQGLPMTKEVFLQLKSLQYHIEGLATQLESAAKAAGQPSTGAGQPSTGAGQPNIGAGQPNIGAGQTDQGAFALQQPNLQGSSAQQLAASTQPLQQSILPQGHSQPIVNQQDQVPQLSMKQWQMTPEALLSSLNTTMGLNSKKAETLGAQGNVNTNNNNITDANVNANGDVVDMPLAASDIAKSSETANVAKQAVDSGLIEVDLPEYVNNATGNRQGLPASDGDVINIPLAKFSERAQSLLSGLVKSPEVLSQTLAYMLKQGIPTQTLDILLVSQYLKGSTGFNSAFQELVDAMGSGNLVDQNGVLQEVQDLLSKFKQQALPWAKWSTEMDGQQLKEHVTSFSELADRISELSIRSETGEYSDQFEALKRTVHIGQEASQWTNLYLPQPLNHMLQDVEIFIKRDQDKSKPIDPDNALLYIALDTENLGRVRVKIQTKPTHLNIVFMIESPAVLNLFEQLSLGLHESVKKHTGKEVHLVFQETLEELNLASLERVDKEGLQLFDMRI